MKFTAIAGALLLASTVVAHPSPENVQKMTERRHERLRKRLANRRTKGNFPLSKNYTLADDTELMGPNKYVSYDDNWAGAVQVDSAITQVTGTFTNPAISKGTGSGNSGAAYWVGIDGDTCQTAILQTGTSGVMSGGKAEYAAWYEWYPHYSYNFENFAVSPGNSITATVKATSKNSGTATITNHATGKTVTHTFTGEAAHLCETNAEWIVEDFESGSSLVEFADFGTVTFTSASYVAGGKTKGVTGSTIIDIKQNGDILAKASLPSSSSVKVVYTGPT